MRGKCPSKRKKQYSVDKRPKPACPPQLPGPLLAWGLKHKSHTLLVCVCAFPEQKHLGASFERSPGRQQAYILPKGKVPPGMNPRGTLERMITGPEP